MKGNKALVLGDWEPGTGDRELEHLSSLCVKETANSSASCREVPGS